MGHMNDLAEALIKAQDLAVAAEARATAAEERVKVLEEAIGWHRENIRRFWSFDDKQWHTHSWHSREDFIEEFNRRTALSREGEKEQENGK